MRRPPAPSLPSPSAIWLIPAAAMLPLCAASQTFELAQAAPAAATPSLSQQVQQLRSQVEAQTQQIQLLRQRLDGQNARQQELERVVQQQGGGAGAGTAVADGAGQRAAPAVAAGAAGAAASQQAGEPGGRVVRVGVAPSDEQPPQLAQVAQIFEQPGILTQPGHFVLEPSLQYGYSSNNRVAIVGYTIIPSLVIGLMDVREVKRHTLTAALTGRMGLTNRLEGEIRIPYVSRRDTSVRRPFNEPSARDESFSANGHAIGDIELGLRYQLNEPEYGKPYYIAGLRYKSTTGKSPFDVIYDCVTKCIDGVTGSGDPLELPTGSGFQSLQANVTWLLPTDPAVFFGGLSYTYNVGRHDVYRKAFGGVSEAMGSIKPGNVWGMNFGMGLALNERSSFSIGMDLNTMGPTKQQGVTLPGSVRIVTSSLLLGYSHRYRPDRTVNISVAAGLTRDTPDLTLSVRVPFSF